MNKVKEWNELLEMGELHEFRDAGEIEVDVDGENCDIAIDNYLD